MIFTKSATVITAYVGPTTTDGIWWPFVLGLAIGIIGGVQAGAQIAKRIKADPSKVIFAIVLFAAAIWTIVRLIVWG